MSNGYCNHWFTVLSHTWSSRYQCVCVCVCARVCAPAHFDLLLVTCLNFLPSHDHKAAPCPESQFLLILTPSAESWSFQTDGHHDLVWRLNELLGCSLRHAKRNSFQSSLWLPHALQRSLPRHPPPPHRDHPWPLVQETWQHQNNEKSNAPALAKPQLGRQQLTSCMVGSWFRKEHTQRRFRYYSVATWNWKKQPQGCKNHTKEHHTMFPMNSLPRGMGRSFLARAKHGHMQCQFRAARSTLLSKGLQSQETKNLQVQLKHIQVPTRELAACGQQLRNIIIYIYIYLYTRVLVSGPEMASWQPAVAGRRIPTPAASSPPLSPLVVTHLAQIGTIQANKSFVWHVHWTLSRNLFHPNRAGASCRFRVNVHDGLWIWPTHNREFSADILSQSSLGMALYFSKCKTC